MSKTHNMSDTQTYNVWDGIIQRTSNRKNRRWKDYGGRGITVSKRWRKFENFYLDMGERPKNRSIDRINNNKGYFKENCRWATNEEQYANMRSNRKITFNGETKTITQWATKLNITHDFITTRLRRGWRIDIALTKPKGGKQRNTEELGW